MQLVSMYRVRCHLVWINTVAEDADKFGDLVLVAGTDYVAVHGDVLLKEAHFVPHVSEESSDFGSEVNHMGRSHLVKESGDSGWLRQVSIRGPRCKVE